MLKTKHIILLLIPAILLAAFGFFIRVVQYEPLYPQVPATTESPPIIPITSEDPILGNPRASTTLIIFEDFACDHCKDLHHDLDTLLQQYPNKIKIVVKGLPVARFPYRTEPAHEYGYCARAQGKYDAFARLAFANNSALSSATLERIANEASLDKTKLADCLAGDKPKNYRDTVATLAEGLHIASVPAIFLNNVQINPPDTVEGWKEVLELK